MDSLMLTFPAQQQGQHLLVETDPSRLRQWLASLPLGDIARTVPEVCRAISSINRTALNLGQRHDLVRLLDNTYAQIFAIYRPQAPHIHTNSQYQNEFEQLHLLTREMAFAHKIIVDNELKKRVFWRKNKELIRSINLSLHYLGLLLMEHYESYSPVPAYIWRECNNLYHYAQHKQIEDFQGFVDGYHQCLSTIELSFSRICLIATADPYHLSRGEHWQIFQYLSKWVHLSEISDDENDCQKTQCFVFDLQSYQKPDYSTLFKQDINDKNIRFLLTDKLVQQLSYQLENSNQEEYLDGFYHDTQKASAINLLRHMLSHWDKRVERHGQRYPVLTKLDVVWGISAINTLLTQHTKHPSTTHWSAEDIEAYLSKHQQVPLKWEAANVSDGGIGVSNNAHIAHHLKVGELVIIREYIDQKPSFRWRLGVCQWLYGDDNHGTKAGFQFIAGSIIPARLFNKLAKNPKGRGQAALLIQPNSQQEIEQKSVIANRGSYKEGRNFLLKTPGLEEDISTRSRTLVTPCIEQFHYQAYESIEVEDNDDDNEESDMIPWTAKSHMSPLKKDPAIDDDSLTDLDSIHLPGDR